ncbi:MAG: ATP-dependent DNA helicase RecG [Candidatus Niyogibacteria bacterium]|nr:ATP-dependent DNA helicase RecG [Candidatus Niyogibacteria bacterium]
MDRPIKNYLHLKPAQEKTLEKFGILAVRDLLWHFPARYENVLPVKSIADLSKGDKAEVSGKIIASKLGKTWKKKLRIAEIELSDGTGVIRAIWFHQPYIAHALKKGVNASIFGTVQEDGRGLYFSNPNYSFIAAKENYQENALSPIYPETRGLSSRWLQYAIRKTLAQLDPDAYHDLIPPEILKKYHLPNLRDSLLYIHTPRNLNDAQAARKRFAFEEIFLIQLSRVKEKMLRDEKPALSIVDTDVLDFLESLPYQLTNAQNKAVQDILEDLRGPSPMARLLEGDVGSGKTVVAAAASYATIKNGYQVAYMAPTEILARQHFKEFTERFSAMGEKIKIGMITSSECLKFPSKVRPNEATHISKSQLLRWTLQGETPMLIGTHALIQDKVRFKNLALVIVDEQHRFGISQRGRLTKKEKEVMPHLLSMTATPIPRTLALTIYGDLDLTLLDEMPPSRKKIITEIVPPHERLIAYEKMRQEISKGRQAYVVCPRINPGEEKADSLLSLNLKAVKEEHKKLAQEIFPEFKIGMLHGKMTPPEKEKAMNEFRDGKTNILVATSVIEVGVNVPNATIILIEGAERFGLAQLHQLRGRVVRSAHEPHCFIFTESESKKTADRLAALTKAENGFELAEYDLEFRGTGELSGKKQWGISDIGMEALKNLKMVEAARNEARILLQKDLELKKYPALKTRMENRAQNAHFE